MQIISQSVFPSPHNVTSQRQRIPHHRGSSYSVCSQRFNPLRSTNHWDADSSVITRGFNRCDLNLNGNGDDALAEPVAMEQNGGEPVHGQRQLNGHCCCCCGCCTMTTSADNDHC